MPILVQQNSIYLFVAQKQQSAQFIGISMIQIDRMMGYINQFLLHFFQG